MAINYLEKLSDEQLFVRYQKNGDNQAFETLYNRYSKKVLAYCIRANRDRDSAYDVFQKSWTAIVEKKDSFIGGSFIAWLMVITRNFCLMEKRGFRPIDEIKSDIPDSNRDYSDDIIELLINEIENLPEDYRNIIKHRYFDGFSYKELAEIFDLSESAVKVRLFRAKKLLNDKLAYLEKDL